MTALLLWAKWRVLERALQLLAERQARSNRRRRQQRGFARLRRTAIETLVNWSRHKLGVSRAVYIMLQRDFLIWSSRLGALRACRRRDPRAGSCARRRRLAKGVACFLTAATAGAKFYRARDAFARRALASAISALRLASQQSRPAADAMAALARNRMRRSILRLRAAFVAMSADVRLGTLAAAGMTASSWHRLRHAFVLLRGAAVCWSQMHVVASRWRACVVRHALAELRWAAATRAQLRGAALWRRAGVWMRRVRQRVAWRTQWRTASMAATARRRTFGLRRGVSGMMVEATAQRQAATTLAQQTILWRLRCVVRRWHTKFRQEVRIGSLAIGVRRWRAHSQTTAGRRAATLRGLRRRELRAMMGALVRLMALCAAWKQLRRGAALGGLLVLRRGVGRWHGHISRLRIAAHAGRMLWVMLLAGRLALWRGRTCMAATRRAASAALHSRLRTASALMAWCRVLVRRHVARGLSGAATAHMVRLCTARALDDWATSAHITMRRRLQMEQAAADWVGHVMAPALRAWREATARQEGAVVQLVGAARHWADGAARRCFSALARFQRFRGRHLSHQLCTRALLRAWSIWSAGSLSASVEVAASDLADRFRRRVALGVLRVAVCHRSAARHIRAHAELHRRPLALRCAVYTWNGCFLRAVTLQQRLPASRFLPHPFRAWVACASRRRRQSWQCWQGILRWQDRASCLAFHVLVRWRDDAAQLDFCRRRLGLLRAVGMLAGWRVRATQAHLTAGRHALARRFCADSEIRRLTLTLSAWARAAFGSLTRTRAVAVVLAQRMRLRMACGFASLKVACVQRFAHVQSAALIVATLARLRAGRALGVWQRHTSSDARRARNASELRVRSRRGATQTALVRLRTQASVAAVQCSARARWRRQGALFALRALVTHAQRASRVARGALASKWRGLRRAMQRLQGAARAGERARRERHQRREADLRAAFRTLQSAAQTDRWLQCVVQRWLVHVQRVLADALIRLVCEAARSSQLRGATALLHARRSSFAMQRWRENAHVRAVRSQRSWDARLSWRHLSLRRGVRALMSCAITDDPMMAVVLMPVITTSSRGPHDAIVPTRALPDGAGGSDEVAGGSGGAGGSEGAGGRRVSRGASRAWHAAVSRWRASCNPTEHAMREAPLLAAAEAAHRRRSLGLSFAWLQQRVRAWHMLSRLRTRRRHRRFRAAFAAMACEVCLAARDADAMAALARNRMRRSILRLRAAFVAMSADVRLGTLAAAGMTASSWHRLRHAFVLLRGAAVCWSQMHVVASRWRACVVRHALAELRWAAATRAQLRGAALWRRAGVWMRRVRQRVAWRTQWRTASMAATARRRTFGLRRGVSGMMVEATAQRQAATTLAQQTILWRLRCVVRRWHTKFRQEVRIGSLAIGVRRWRAHSQTTAGRRAATLRGLRRRELRAMMGALVRLMALCAAWKQLRRGAALGGLLVLRRGVGRWHGHISRLRIAAHAGRMLWVMLLAGRLALWRGRTCMAATRRAASAALHSRLRTASALMAWCRVLVRRHVARGLSGAATAHMVRLCTARALDDWATSAHITMRRRLQMEQAAADWVGHVMAPALRAWREATARQEGAVVQLVGAARHWADGAALRCMEAWKGRRPAFVSPSRPPAALRRRFRQWEGEYSRQLSSVSARLTGRWSSHASVFRRWAVWMRRAAQEAPRLLSADSFLWRRGMAWALVRWNASLICQSTAARHHTLRPALRRLRRVTQQRAQEGEQVARLQHTRALSRLLRALIALRCVRHLDALEEISRVSRAVTQYRTRHALRLWLLASALDRRLSAALRLACQVWRHSHLAAGFVVLGRGAAAQGAARRCAHTVRHLLQLRGLRRLVASARARNVHETAQRLQASGGRRNAAAAYAFWAAECRWGQMQLDQHARGQRRKAQRRGLRGVLVAWAAHAAQRMHVARWISEGDCRARREGKLRAARRWARACGLGRRLTHESRAVTLADHAPPRPTLSLSHRFWRVRLRRAHRRWKGYCGLLRRFAYRRCLARMRLALGHWHLDGGRRARWRRAVRRASRSAALRRALRNWRADHRGASSRHEALRSADVRRRRRRCARALVCLGDAAQLMGVVARWRPLWHERELTKRWRRAARARMRYVLLLGEATRACRRRSLAACVRRWLASTRKHRSLLRIGAAYSSQRRALTAIVRRWVALLPALTTDSVRREHAAAVGAQRLRRLHLSRWVSHCRFGAMAWRVAKLWRCGTIARAFRSWGGVTASRSMLRRACVRWGSAAIAFAYRTWALASAERAAMAGVWARWSACELVRAHADWREAATAGAARQRAYDATRRRALAGWLRRWGVGLDQLHQMRLALDLAACGWKRRCVRRWVRLTAAVAAGEREECAMRRALRQLCGKAAARRERGARAIRFERVSSTRAAFARLVATASEGLAMRRSAVGRWSVIALATALAGLRLNAARLRRTRCLLRAALSRAAARKARAAFAIWCADVHLSESVTEMNLAAVAHWWGGAGRLFFHTLRLHYKRLSGRRHAAEVRQPQLPSPVRLLLSSLDVRAIAFEVGYALAAAFVRWQQLLLERISSGRRALLAAASHCGLSAHLAFARMRRWVASARVSRDAAAALAQWRRRRRLLPALCALRRLAHLVRLSQRARRPPLASPFALWVGRVRSMPCLAVTAATSWRCRAPLSALRRWRDACQRWATWRLSVATWRRRLMWRILKALSLTAQRGAALARAMAAARDHFRRRHAAPHLAHAWSLWPRAGSALVRDVRQSMRETQRAMCQANERSWLRLTLRRWHRLAALPRAWWRRALSKRLLRCMLRTVNPRMRLGLLCDEVRSQSLRARARAALNRWRLRVGDRGRSPIDERRFGLALGFVKLARHALLEMKRRRVVFTSSLCADAVHIATALQHWSRAARHRRRRVEQWQLSSRYHRCHALLQAFTAISMLPINDVTLRLRAVEAGGWDGGWDGGIDPAGDPGGLHLRYAAPHDVFGSPRAVSVS